MKKRIAYTAVALTVASISSAQQNYTDTTEQSLFESVTKIEKKTDKFNLYLNMHGDFKSSWTGSEFEGGKFEFQQLRLEMKGQLNDWLSYRYRQRLNKGDDPNGYYDNVLKSIDIAGIGLNFNKWQLFLGKQCAAYGGIEFDLNPIEIYQYSDMVDYMTNFMTGVNIAYNFTPNQQLQFQVLDALVGSSQSMYGNYTRAKMPFVYTLNWNGNFNNVYSTRWSASFMNETKNEHMWYFALGNNFNISRKVQAYFDWLYSLEGVDRKGIITDIVQPDGYDYKSKKVDYMSFVWHVNYRFHPNWNIFAKLMYENEGVYKAQGEKNTPDYIAKGRYRTAWGYIGGIEYYPFKDKTLHFFATYVGRKYDYTSRAKAYGVGNYSTNQLQVGFIWQMPVF